MSFNAACSACEKRQQWQQALGMLSEMEYQHLEPNVISFNAAISACEKGNQWQQALGILSGMQHRQLGPDVISFSAAITACEKDEHYDALSSVPKGSLTVAAAFGNVHGVCAPRNLSVKPEILHNTQKYMEEKPS